MPAIKLLIMNTMQSKDTFDKYQFWKSGFKFEKKRESCKELKLELI